VDDQSVCGVFKRSWHSSIVGCTQIQTQPGTENLADLGEEGLQPCMIVGRTLVGVLSASACSPAPTDCCHGTISCQACPWGLTQIMSRKVTGVCQTATKHHRTLSTSCFRCSVASLDLLLMNVWLGHCHCLITWSCPEHGHREASALEFELGYTLILGLASHFYRYRYSPQGGVSLIASIYCLI
jgi:hypothetical protein